jgi:hypothetical protein
MLVPAAPRKQSKRESITVAAEPVSLTSDSSENHSKSRRRNRVQWLGANNASVGEMIQSSEKKAPSKLSHAALNKPIYLYCVRHFADQIILPIIIWSN